MELPAPAPPPIAAPAPAPLPASLLAQVQPPITYARTPGPCEPRDVTRNFSLPTVVGAEPGQPVTSACFTVAGLTQPTEFSVLRGSYSVDGGAFVPGATRTALANGDRLVLRMNASATPNEERWEDLNLDTAAGRTILQWTVRTRNSTRAPRTWQVGPARTHTELSRSRRCCKNATSSSCGAAP
ncbi:MAG TPA: hypothetical protein VEA40_09765 [Ramlibacter sp.]|nr:hypothetical protein [Ramlibacter sp.]